MKRQPRFELVRSDAGWFARFIAANGREVWRTSETYIHRRAVVRALQILVQAVPEGDRWPVWREVDERGEA